MPNFKSVEYFLVVDFGEGSSSCSSCSCCDRGKTKSTPCPFDFDWNGLGLEFDKIQEKCDSLSSAILSKPKLTLT